MIEGERERKPKTASGIRPKERNFTGDVHNTEQSKTENDKLNQSASQRNLSLNNDYNSKSDFKVTGYSMLTTFFMLEKFYAVKLVVVKLN